MFRRPQARLLAGAVLLLSACGGSDGDGFPPEPTVAAVSLEGPGLVSGGTGTFTATVQSSARAERVVVDFYLVDPLGSCAGLGQPVASTVPFDLAYNLLEASASSHRQARFFATGIAYTPDTGLREAKITQSFQAPILTPGTYAVVGSVRGKEPACRKSPDAATVTQASRPDLVHSFTRATRHSFRLGPAAKRVGRNRPPAVLSVSSEIANVGLVWDGDVEVGFLLEIDGVDYPLQVEATDVAGNATHASRHTYARRTRQGTPEAMMQGDVRGATHHLHLGSAAEEKLRNATADKTCTLKLVIDPDRKIPDADATGNVATVPVQFLAGAAPCPVDPGMASVQYCFGPGGASQGASDNGDVAGSYQFADTEANPTYLASGPASAAGIPSVVKSYAKTDSAFGQSSGTSSLLQTELVWSITPPQPGTTAGMLGDGQAGHVDGSQNVGVFSNVVISRDFTNLAAEAGYSWYRKDVKKVLFKETYEVGDIPVKVEIGVKGELGLQGKIHVQGAPDYGFVTVDIDVGPYMGVAVYAEASVDMVLCEVGVGFDLTIAKFSVAFQLALRSAIDSTGGTGSGLELSVGVPLTINALSGDLYAFVKILEGVHTWKYPIVAWEGWTWVIDLTPAGNFYFGKPGSFMVDGIQDGNVLAQEIVHGVFTEKVPVYGTDRLHWIGNVQLNASTYRFTWSNVGSVVLRGAMPDQRLVTSCSTGGSGEVTVPVTGSYTLEVTTDYGCWRNGSPSVTWAEVGQSGVGSASGYAGTTSGAPACAVNRWYYNQDVFAGSPAPVDFACDDDVDLQIPWDQQPAGWIHAPTDGLWVKWTGSLPTFDASVDKVLVWFQGNPDAPVGCYGTWPGGSGIIPYWNGGDLLELVVTDATGAVVFTNQTPTHQPLSFGTGSTGNAYVEIPLTGTAPYAYVLKYHPINHSDCGDRPGADPRDAALKMTVVPLGRWLVETTCGAPGLVTLPPVSVAGPADPTVGTLTGGSVSLLNRCSGLAWGSFPVQERVVGAFDFRTLPASGQAFDFFTGALSPHGYKLWIDGALLSARGVMDPASLPHDYRYCFQGQCTVREAHVATTLSRGYHVIEGHYAATDQYDRWGDGSDNRIRWATQGNGNRTLGYLYSTAEEVDAVLAGDATGGTPWPLMVLDSPTPVPPSISWTDDWKDPPNACNAYVNGQLSCYDSLVGVGQFPYLYSFSSLWEGTYAMADQVPYLYTLTTNCDEVDLWLDNTSYSRFQTGLTNPVAFHPFPPGSPASFFGVLMNKQSPTNQGLNSIRIAIRCRWYYALTAEMSSDWTPAAPGTYLAVFLGADGVPVAGTTTTGNHGTGQAQALCVGAGCPDVTRIPPDATTILLLASPTADPAGTFQSAGSGSVDLVVDMAGTAGATVDLCANGWCGTGHAPTGQVASPSFLPYSSGASGGTASGIQSGQPSPLLFRITRPGATWPDGASYRFQLGYRAHAW